MKHLKKIYEFVELNKLSKEILDDIKDICLELQDDGFIIREERCVDHKGIFSKNIDSVSIFKYNGIGRYDNFNYSVVKEYIDRIKDYMNMNGYSTDVIIIRDEDSSFKRNIKLHNKIFIYKVRLRFSKKEKDSQLKLL